MVELDWETERTDGVTLVRLYVTSEYRRRVRVESRLDGPVWPPRREGQPAVGWDDEAFEGVVTPEDRLVAGFATPATPEDPPVEVVSEEPADPDAPPGPAGGSVAPLDGGRGETATTDGGNGAGASGGAGVANGRTGDRSRARNGDGGTGATDGEPTPEAVVRSLGDPVVPREAVPVPDAGTGSDDGAESASTDATDDDGRSVEERANSDDREADGERTDDGPADGSGSVDDGEREQQATGESGTAEQPRSPDGAVPPGTDAELVVPGAVRAWLRDVDRRLRAVERRRAAEETDAEPTLQVAVAADRRALAQVADRVETLAGRAAAVERRAGGDGRR